MLKIYYLGEFRVISYFLEVNVQFSFGSLHIHPRMSSDVLETNPVLLFHQNFQNQVDDLWTEALLVQNLIYSHLPCRFKLPSLMLLRI